MTINMSNIWSPLMEPTRIAGLEMQNHFVMAPMTREQCAGGVPTETVAEYYARRAGTLGMVITEGVYVDTPSAGTSDSVPRLDSEEALQGWSRVITQVHANGAKIMPQLWHLGCVRRAGTPPFPNGPVVTPSGKTLGGKSIGEEATLAQIDEVIDAFARAAVVAKGLGFDGVELHGAHGYLLDQFLWNTTNIRKDKYGGSLINRARLSASIISEIRNRVGESFPIQFRFSQWKGGRWDASIVDNPGELGDFLEYLVDAGVDIFHPSTRRFWTPAFEGSDLTLAGWTKKLTDIPTIAVGHVGVDTAFRDDDSAEKRIFEPAELISLYERGEFDLVAVGRALLADPDWVRKATTKIGTVSPYTKESESHYF